MKNSDYTDAEQRTLLKLQNWQQEWSNKIPQLQFPPEWKIRIWPPMYGALIRFQVNARISVYLDVEDNLGCVGKPYWEIYPNDDGDTSRFLMEETDELLAGIASALAAE